MDIPKLETESDIVYAYRQNYVNMHFTEYNKSNLIKLSKIAANIKFKQCTYEPKIVKQLEQ